MRERDRDSQFYIKESTTKRCGGCGGGLIFIIAIVNVAIGASVSQNIILDIFIVS